MGEYGNRSRRGLPSGLQSKSRGKGSNQARHSQKLARKLCQKLDIEEDNIIIDLNLAIQWYKCFKALFVWLEHV